MSVPYELQTARDMQKAAIVMARSAELMARVMAMHTENHQRTIRNESIAYTSDDFERAIDECGCGHNNIHQLMYLDP